VAELFRADIAIRAAALPTGGAIRGGVRAHRGSFGEKNVVLRSKLAASPQSNTKRFAVLADHDVRRLDVAVNDTHVMRIGDRIAGTYQVFQTA